MKLTLSKPIKHGDELVVELDLREPTAKEIKVIGLPLNVKDEDVRTEVIHKYICALAVLPPSVVDQMSAKDFIGAMGVVMNFFGES